MAFRNLQTGLRNPSEWESNRFIRWRDAKGYKMAKPEEVKLQPGWLRKDIRNAQTRLAEWHGSYERDRSPPERLVFGDEEASSDVDKSEIGTMR